MRHESRRPSRARFAEYRRRRASHPDATALPEPGDRAGPRARRVRSVRALIGELWRLTPGLRGRIGVALAALTVATLIGLILPASTKFAFDYILTDNPGPAGVPAWLGLPRDPAALLWILGGAMTAASLVAVVVGTFGRWLMTWTRLVLQARLRRRAFEHAVRLPLHRVHTIRSGGLASLLREDAAGAGELLFSAVYNPLRAIIQLVGTVVILFIVDWRLVLGALALMPIIWFTHRTWINRIRPIYRDIRATRQRIDAQTTEVFAGVRVVRAFSREAGEAARFVRDTHLMARQEALVWWRSRAIEIAWALLIPVASTAVLVYGGLGVIRGTLTIGDVVMFTTYLVMLLAPLETLASTATQIQNSLAGFDRTLDLLAEPTEFVRDAGARRVGRGSVRGRVTLEGVTFRYPGAPDDTPPVLAEVSLDARPGETIALVGSSGAGKTTLCNLVARFYDPTAGRVTLDGVDLREIDLGSYRRLLGVVEQDVFLFDGTVAENIAFARPEASRDEIVAAARAADAHAFIESFDDGYDALIGERGVRVSGGQRQRLAIARAVLADPRILILDEATSSLDSESERQVQASLSRLLRGRTSFVIAHRLSTIRHADRIVVLDRGRVVEVGPHEDLWARGGRYATLLTLQLGENAADLERAGDALDPDRLSPSTT
ncbi:MAG: ABC transporter ATP-binding protein [Planctomycetota bacterium]|nr:MAG: ABC transporter ATP-binding protein [Planctomycetota bacterium]